MATVVVVTGERLQALATLTRCRRSDRAWQPSLARLPHVCIEDLPTVEHVRKHPIVDANTVMVYTHYIDWFFEHVLPHMRCRFVLLSHNSDHGVEAKHLQYLDAPSSKIIRWYAQNATVQHPRIVPAPIGLANAQFPHGNIAALEAVAAASQPKTQLCYLQFTNTNPAVRERCKHAVQARMPSLQWKAERPFPEYVRNLAQHRYAICPQGNGLDTHRLWECLYLRVIPVVVAGGWPSLGMPPVKRLPVLELSDWSDLSEALLEERFAELSARWEEPAWQQVADVKWYASSIAADLSSERAD